MKKIGVLYICTGKYSVFWKGFFESCDKHFFNKKSDYEVHYFLFTDVNELLSINYANIHPVYQENLSWPYPTLHRFKMFNSISEKLDEMDYLFFFNANVEFVQDVNLDILPKENQDISVVTHPGFFDKPRRKFTYEMNKKSLAFIPRSDGTHYVMGGVNGGRAKPFLAMSAELDRRIQTDLSKGIIAVWHDESHLNKYVSEHADATRVLDCSYGVPEDWQIPFVPKIIIRNKDKSGDFTSFKSSVASSDEPRLQTSFASRVANFKNRLLKRRFEDM